MGIGWLYWPDPLS